jgi:hypothetical protein
MSFSIKIKLVLPPGIEPGSDALQAPAMTTSAKVANKTGCIFTVLIKSQMYKFLLLTSLTWCSIEESNHDCRTTKPEYYHYTNRANKTG